MSRVAHQWSGFAGGTGRGKPASPPRRCDLTRIWPPCVRAGVRVVSLNGSTGTGGQQYDDAGVDGGDGGGAAAGFQKALSVVDLESRLDVGGEVVETVLSVLEGEPYRWV